MSEAAASRIVPVILSGGAGHRLWPLSTPERPKQMLPLVGAETMLVATARRVADTSRFQAPVFVAGQAHGDAIERKLGKAGIAPAALILEPEGRNTGPAIALAAFHAAPDDMLLVMPSDHVIANEAAFLDAVAAALPFAADGWIATFGAKLSGPETGYGYILAGSALADGLYEAQRFVEKPDRATAERYVAEGGWAWNCGIFLFRASTLREALVAYAPAIAEAAAAAIADARRQGAHILPDSAAFARAPSISIDHAVMEKAERIALAPVDMGWSDLGSWDALHALGEADDDGNVLIGDAIAMDSRNCLIRSDGGPTIAALGVEDLIIVASRDGIVVVPRGESQRLRQVSEILRERGQRSDPDLSGRRT